MSDVPRLNHVAISMDPEVLDDQGRTDILAFYGDVFGWTEGDNTGEEGDPLILYTGVFGQFVYLLPGGAGPGGYMVTPRLDHFGLSVRSIEQLETTVARAKVYDDDRVQIIDVETRITHGPEHDYTLTSAYIGFLLPLMIELQHFERQEKAKAKA
jgi:catechol 2,3-dioxygenase-like lactoylglutathione lyase family enzyme